MTANAILRVGAATCFLGHGAFGLITKAVWLPYFAVAGIPPSVAWRMMPLIGVIDILAAMIVLFEPRRLPLIYMTVWGTWTALLRPLAGESVFEAFERAGNYGVPLALLLLAGAGSLTTPLGPPRSDPKTMSRVRETLKWTTCLLLFAHGALGIAGKPMLVAHYAAVGFPAATASVVGWFECAIAALVVVRPDPQLLVFIAAWKLATESLFLVNGQPVWELVERGGSYAAPLALAVLAARHARKTLITKQLEA